MATIEEDGYENYINEKKGMAAAIYHPQYCEEGSWKVVVWDLEEGYDEDTSHVGLYEWIEEAEEFLIDKNVKPSNDSLKQAITLTGFFIDKFLKKNNKKLPFYRKKILN